MEDLVSVVPLIPAFSHEGEGDTARLGNRYEGAVAVCRVVDWPSFSALGHSHHEERSIGNQTVPQASRAGRFPSPGGEGRVRANVKLTSFPVASHGWWRNYR